MVDTSVDKFSVFVPFDIIEKSGKDGNPEMVIKGVASTRKKDTDDEILEPDGFDVTKFMKSGFLNYNHLASKDPSMIIGEPTKAVAKNGELYIEGVLYPESEMAQKVYQTAKVLRKGSKTRSFGFSIEGKALERDPFNPKRITKAEITGCAITPSPKNSGTSMEIVKGGIDAMDFSPEDGEEFLIDVTDESGVRTTVDKNFVIEKSEPVEALEFEELNDLEKGKGEGSRGGKVIGHTKSGKPIYENATADHHSYKNFSEQDHKDAADAHYKHYHKDGADGSTVLHGKRSLESHIKKFQKAILEEYDLDDDVFDIEKGGEGSRGGKVIGHTKSGKPVYADHNHDHKDYDNFSAQDHHDASDLHKKETDKYRGAYNDAVLRSKHDNMRFMHRKAADKKSEVKKAEGVQEASTAAEMDGVTAKESLELGKRKKKKSDQDKKTFSKAETYEQIFSMFNCNVMDAPHLYKLIEDIQYVLTPDMEKVQITSDAIKKAQEILGLASAPAAAPATTTTSEDADALKKADEQKKIQAELDETLKKAEELKTKLSGAEVKPAVEAAAPAPAKTDIIKAEDNDIVKAMNEKFTALGTLIQSKDEQLNLLKGENDELKKGISEITEFNKRLAQKIGMIEQQPLDRKSVTTTKFIEKGEGNEGGNGTPSGIRTLSLSDKTQRAQLADLLYKAATANPAGLDRDFAKAVQCVELGSLGDSQAMAARLHARVQNELKINVVK